VPDGLTWTTEYYTLAVKQLRADGRSVPGELLAHISPGHSDNINFFGVINVDIEAELAKLTGGVAAAAARPAPSAGPGPGPSSFGFGASRAGHLDGRAQGDLTPAGSAGGRWPWLCRSVLTPLIGQLRIQLLINRVRFAGEIWLRCSRAGALPRSRGWPSSVACQGRSATGSACGCWRSSESGSANGHQELPGDEPDYEM